ncbi:hypothetical protein N665_3463s0002, partial [Sinapis alba]
MEPSSISSGIKSGTVESISTVEEPGATGSVVEHTDPKTPTVASNSQDPKPFVPSLGAWSKPPKLVPDVVSSGFPLSVVVHVDKVNTKSVSGKPPPEVKADGTLRFPWAAKMDPSIRNLYRTTTPSFMEDGTPKVIIPDHVLMKGLENQKEYIIGQFCRCNAPSGGLVHAVTNRIWGRKCKIITRKLGETSYLFHIPDKFTRDWVLQRGLWHVDDCIMFVAPWTPAATLALPEITTVPVWVTLKSIPSRLYSIEAISWIASGLGEPMVTNKPWLDPTQVGESKLLVEVEIEKGFPERIAAADKQGNVSIVDVEYSWRPTKCKKCGHIGHKESRCLLRSDQTILPAKSVSNSGLIYVAQPTSDSTNVSVPVTPAIIIDAAVTNSVPEAVQQCNNDDANVVGSVASQEAPLDYDSLAGPNVATLPAQASHIEVSPQNFHLE